jgi:hypothetical protein
MSPGLTLKDANLYYTACLCFVRFLRETATVHLNSIKSLVTVMEGKCNLFEVRTVCVLVCEVVREKSWTVFC